MYQAIVFLPLIGYFIASIFGRVIGAKASEFITSGLVVLAALLSWVAFFEFLFSESGTLIVDLFRWINSGTLNVNWSIRVDTLTVVMLVVVTSVSSLVHIYSIGYMHSDPHRPRFFAYLSLFTFAMLTLVTANNLLQMFFGWEGVGLASYLLIGFWFHKPSANAAAIKAFVVNRVGDFGFALGIFGVFYLFNSIDLEIIFAGVQGFVETPSTEPAMQFLGWSLNNNTALTVVCLLLFMGAMGKSAQFLLHTWLPDAMEGPTPVSALIHAATMVTAGVFMVARLSPLFEFSPVALTVIICFGATTAIFAATVGLVQNDIKRVIAYSTCSQLGYMFVALGVGAYSIGIFHLFTHAFFKALLFLCAGSVIHAVSDQQDMRKMGGLRKHLPITYWTMLIGTLAITGVGIPFTHFGFAGFVSKDAIIEASYAAAALGPGAFALYGFWLTVIAAAMTSFYSWRLIFMTFHGQFRSSAEVKNHVHESPLSMTIPLVLLTIGSIFAGYVFYGQFVGEQVTEFWRDSLFFSAQNTILEDLHHVDSWVKLSPFIMMLIGFGIAWQFYIRNPELPKQLAKTHQPIYKFLLNKWYFDELYDYIFVKPSLWLARVFWQVGDGKVIDGYGPNGVARRVLDLSKRVVRLQTGYIYHYAFGMLIGVAILITWAMFTGGGGH